MYQLFTWRAKPEGAPYICCKFPYAKLDEFKRAVPRDDRFWMPPLQTWVLSIHGANCLMDAHAEQMAPITWDVLDALHPPRIEGPTPLRLAGTIGA